MIFALAYHLNRPNSSPHNENFDMYTSKPKRTGIIRHMATSSHFMGEIVLVLAYFSKMFLFEVAIVRSTLTNKRQGLWGPCLALSVPTSVYPRSCNE
jgi:hypothetical protein